MKTLKIVSVVLVTLYFVLCGAHAVSPILMQTQYDIFYFDSWSYIVGLFAFPVTIIFLCKRL